MTDETYRRAGWSSPGEDLPYKYALRKNKMWPPRPVGKVPGTDDERRPVTPFLLLPATPFDVGERETGDASWIDSSSLLLVDPDWNVSTTPRLGVSYRILALVRNIGDAPALTSFVEFRMVAPPFLATGAFGHDPLHEGIDLGVAALSIGGRKTSWALSPNTWTPSDGLFDLGLCMAARVLEPSRSSPEDWSPWSDRHVALRDLAPNLSGTWVGTETQALPDGDPGHAPVIGEIRLGLSVTWPLATHGGPDPENVVVWPRECSMTILGLAPFNGRQIPVGSVHGTNFSYGGLRFEMPTPDRPYGTRMFFLQMQSDDELSLVTVVQDQGGPGQEDRTTAVLRRDGPPVPAPEIDLALLHGVDLDVGPLAPQSRREEAVRLKAIRDG
jgi:hypothetical protein